MFRPRVIALLLVLITLVAYLPVLQDQFLSFDDETYVSSNKHIQDGVTISSVKWAFTSYYASNWHPMTWITCMVDYELFRQNPAGHHFVNVLFHSANAGLLFILLLRLTGGLWTSAFVAALFAWHPLRVESVAWIAELKDVSSVFWGLLAMLAYVHYVECSGQQATLRSGLEPAHLEPKRIKQPAVFYFLSLTLYALSLMSKSMLVTLPFVLLLLDYWPLHRAKAASRCVLEKLPFLLLAAGVSIATFIAQKNTAMISLTVVPFHLRVENAVVAYAEYLWKTVWPADLAILYPLPDQIFPATLALSALTLAGLSMIAVLGARQLPWFPIGWLWYLGTLVPVIGLVQVGSQAMADRYTYFPTIGVFIAVTMTVAAMARRFQIPRVFLATAAGIILAACLLRTEFQLRYWRNTQTLFTHALKHTINNPLAHLVLGDAYQESQEPDKALAEYQEALKLSNRQPNIYQSIGRVLAEQGHFEEGLKYYAVAVQLKPSSPELHDSIGVIYIDLKKYKEAEQEFAEAIRLDPTYAPAHFRMGWLLLGNGRGAEALKQFREVIRLEPDNVERLLYIARVMATSENPQVRNGAEACQLALRVKVLTGGNQPGVLDTLAAAYAECGHFDEAMATEQQALTFIKQTGANEDESAMRGRLELYRKHQPWRNSFTSPQPSKNTGH